MAAHSQSVNFGESSNQTFFITNRNLRYVFWNRPTWSPKFRVRTFLQSSKVRSYKEVSALAPKRSLDCYNAEHTIKPLKFNKATSDRPEISSKEANLIEGTPWNLLAENYKQVRKSVRRALSKWQIINHKDHSPLKTITLFQVLNKAAQKEWKHWLGIERLAPWMCVRRCKRTVSKGLGNAGVHWKRALHDSLPLKILIVAFTRTY